MVDARALDNADLSDVKFLVNHMGKPLARNTNDTLKLVIDGNALHVTADLTKSFDARNTCEEIKNKLLTEMSWGYIPKAVVYDPVRKIRIIKEISKVLDVSVVNSGQNKKTYIE